MLATDTILDEFHLSVGRKTNLIDTKLLKDLFDQDLISNKLTEDSPILNAQIGSAFMTLLYNNICNDIDKAIGIHKVSDVALEDVFTKFLANNANIVVTKNAKTFLKKRKKLENGISVYSDSFYVPKTGSQMSFRVFLKDEPLTVDVTTKDGIVKIVVGGHEKLSREYYGELSKYSSQTSISDDKIIGYIKKILMAKLPVYELDIIRRPYVVNDGRGEREELYYDTSPRKVFGADGQQVRAAVWNLHATRVTTIGDNFMRDITSKEKVHNSLQPFVLYSHDKNCIQKSKTMLNQSNDGGGFLISSLSEIEDIEGNITDKLYNAKIMGELFVSRTTEDGRDYKVIAKLFKANLDIISFDEAIAFDIIKKKDIENLRRAYQNGVNIIISNDNPIKHILEINDEQLDIDPKLKSPIGYYGIIDINSRLKLDPGASFNGVVRSLPVEVYDYFVENGLISANSSGVLSFNGRAFNALNVTAYDIIGKPILEPLLYVKSQAIKDYLTGGNESYVLMYRFPLDGNFAVCKVIVDENMTNNVKPTAYAMYCVGGDFDGDGAGYAGTDISTSETREYVCERLKIFDTRKTTDLNKFLEM